MSCDLTNEYLRVSVSACCRNVEALLISDYSTTNKLAKLGDAIAISNLKLSITDPLTH